MRLTPNTTLAPYFENGDYHDNIMLPQIFFDFRLVSNIIVSFGRYKTGATWVMGGGLPQHHHAATDILRLQAGG